MPATSTTPWPAPPGSAPTSPARCAAATSRPATGVISGARWGDVGAFVRYEDVDTQARMPAGYVPLEEFDRSVWAVGATYWPDPDIAIKVDYLHQRNKSAVVRPPHSFNLGLGWWF